MRLSQPKLFVFAVAALVATAALAGFAAFFSGTFKYSPTGGDISPYLVGFYDTDGEAEVEVFLVNPTPYDLEAWVVRYDDDEQPVECSRLYLSPNDMEEFEIDDSNPEEGVIKVLSVRAPVHGRSIHVQSGVVGWVRHKTGGDDFSIGLSDTELKSMPAALLSANGGYELWAITDYVYYNCAGAD